MWPSRSRSLWLLIKRLVQELGRACFGFESSTWNTYAKGVLHMFTQYWVGQGTMIGMLYTLGMVALVATFYMLSKAFRNYRAVRRYKQMAMRYIKLRARMAVAMRNEDLLETMELDLTSTRLYHRMLRYWHTLATMGLVRSHGLGSSWDPGYLRRMPLEMPEPAPMRKVPPMVGIMTSSLGKITEVR